MHSTDEKRTKVCPVELAGSLDNTVRRWLQNPRKILGPYVREGMTVLDVGCGPGFFTVELAAMVGATGHVIAADLQEGMLRRLREKIQGTELEGRIEFVRCDEEKINVSRAVDFALTFYMVHEVPDKERFFRELRGLLKENGKILLVEPKLFHVSRRSFEETTRVAHEVGLAVGPGPRLPLSWTAILKPE